MNESGIIKISFGSSSSSDEFMFNTTNRAGDLVKRVVCDPCNKEELLLFLEDVRNMSSEVFGEIQEILKG